MLQVRKSGRNLSLDDALAYTEGSIAQRAQPLAGSARRFPAQRTQASNRRAHCVILGAVGQRRFFHRSSLALGSVISAAIASGKWITKLFAREKILDPPIEG